VGGIEEKWLDPMVVNTHEEVYSEKKNNFAFKIVEIYDLDFGVNPWETYSYLSHNIEPVKYNKEILLNSKF
jgi:hypothetical protein